MSENFGEYWEKQAKGRGFHLNVVAHGERDQIIDRCKEAVAAHHGDILDFKMFSNLALNMIVEMSGSGVLSLVAALRDYGWKVKFEPEKEVLARSGTQNLEGTLQLTFAEGDGEMRVTVPEVPG